MIVNNAPTMALQSQHFEIHPSLIEKNDFFSPPVKILVLLVRISRHRNKKYERRLVLHLAVVRVSPGPHFDSVVVCSVQCFGGVDDPPVSVVPYSKRYLFSLLLIDYLKVRIGVDRTISLSHDRQLDQAAASRMARGLVEEVVADQFVQMSTLRIIKQTLTNTGGWILSDIVPWTGEVFTAVRALCVQTGQTSTTSGDAKVTLVDILTIPSI